MLLYELWYASNKIQSKEFMPVFLILKVKA